MASSYEGGCDHVRVTASAEPIDNHECHCNVCKSVTGQQHTHVAFFNWNDLTADHPDKIVRQPFNKDNPDGPLELCTCTECGAALMLDDKEKRIRVATGIEGLCGPIIQTVSGGNSANLPWALGKQFAGRISDLRLGEAILLGVDRQSGDRKGEMHTDASTLVAEVIETGAKPAASPVTLVDPQLAKFCIGSGGDEITRLILAIGHQDMDISGLSIAVGSTLIGATSDHLVIETERWTLWLGSEMRFQMKYKALMHAMAAPNVETQLLDDRSSRQSRHSQCKAGHLSLV